MIEFNEADLAYLQKKMNRIVTQDVPEVTFRALNSMAFAVFNENKKLMASVFDSPVPYTIHAFAVRMATKVSQVAVVERKTPVAGRHYLEVQEKGGARRKSGFERLIERNIPYSGIIQSVLPTKHMLNKSGNMHTGRLQQILSAVQAQGDSHQNTTAASAKRAKGKRAGYFVPRDGSSLSPGVYERRGKAIRKMLAFSDKVPTYEARFPMVEHGAMVAEAEAAPAFETAMARVLGRGA